MTRHTTIAALFLLVACGRTERPEPVRIVHVETGRQASFDEMLADLATVPLVYVGESHDDEAHHRLQAAIVRELHRRDPSLAIGLEMFQRPYQQALDDYVAGRIDRSEMLERTEWEERWGFDFELYEPVLEHAREHGLRLVALNAPTEVTRTVGREGLGGLDASQREGLAELDLEDARHREMVREALESHGHMAPEMLERFYTAQVIWDETMAESVAEAMAGPDAPRRMVVLAGRMHVQEGRGIPARAARRGARPYRVVLPADHDDPPGREPPPADWLVLF